jgi:hypothetical protein
MRPGVSPTRGFAAGIDFQEAVDRFVPGLKPWPADEPRKSASVQIFAKLLVTEARFFAPICLRSARKLHLQGYISYKTSISEAIFLGKPPHSRRNSLLLLLAPGGQDRLASKPWSGPTPPRRR